MIRGRGNKKKRGSVTGLRRSFLSTDHVSIDDTHIDETCGESEREA